MVSEFSQRSGIVVSIWGKAYIRAANGQWRLLKLGEIVHPVDQLLTEQDAIVMLTDSQGPARPFAVPATSATETDRVIAALEANDRDAAPGAGLVTGDGGGFLPGLRVDRIAEALSPADLVTSLDALPSALGQLTPGAGRDASEAPALSAAWSSLAAAEDGAGLALGLAAPRGTGPLQVVVTQVPSQGQIVTAAGRVLAVGSTIEPAELPGLRYLPPADHDGVSPIGGFAYSVSNGSSTVSGGTQITLSAVNDAPVARAGTLGSNEDALVAVAIGGSDVDGTVTSVRISAVPANGTLLLADGVTPVTAGSVLTAAQASSLLFRPAPDFHGTTAVVFSVTDDDGTSSATATLTIVVSPVADAPVAADDSASTVAGTPVTVAVLANDRDSDGDALRLDGASVDASLGTLRINADGSLTFTAAPGLSGAVPIAYAVSDGSGRSASASLNIQVLPPLLSVDGPALSADNTPQFSGSSNLAAGTPITLTVTGADGARQFLGAVLGADGRYAVEAPLPLSEGPYRIEASASVPGTGAISAIDGGTIDTLAPSLRLEAPAIVSDLTPTVGGTTDLPAGSSVSLTVTDALGAVQSFTAIVQPDGSFAADVPAALAQGAYSVVAAANDRAGNVASASAGGAVDTVAPTLTLAAPVITNDSTPTIGGTTDLAAGSTVTLTVTDALGAVQTFSATVLGDGSFSAAVPTVLAQGSYSVAARAGDAAGNAANTLQSGVIDLTAPRLAIDALPITNDSTPTIFGTTDLPAGSAITLTATDALGAVQTFSATVLAGGGFSAALPAALADGAFSVTASATDAAGNTASANGAGAIDATAPTLTVDAPAVTNDSTPTISGTTDLPAGSTITLTVTDALGAVQTLTALVQAGGSFSATVPAALSEGSFSVSASATDAAGNTANANGAGTVDATAPMLTIDAPTVTNNSTPTISGTTDLPAGSTITLTVTDALGAVQTFTATVLAGGSFSAAVPAALAEGSFSVTASASDAAGNAASTNDAGALDATAPTLTVDAPAITNDSTPTISGTTDLPAGSAITLTVTDALGTVQTFTTAVQAGGSFSAAVPAALAEGSFSVTSNATDAAGNSATANAAGAVDATAPTLTVAAPSLTKDATPPITGTTDLSAGATITLTVTDTLGAVQTFTATVLAGGGFSADVPAALAEGSFSVTASASDAAGNAASANDIGSIDTSAPTLTVDAPALTNDAAPTITGTTDLPAGSAITLTVTDALGAVQTFTATVQADGSFSAEVPAALAQGSYGVVATASDLAGNLASANHAGAIDTTAPTLTVFAPALTNDSTPVITGSIDLPAGSSVALTVTDSLGAVQTFVATVQAGGSFSAELPSALAQGGYAVVATASDLAGNAASANGAGTVDASAPTLTLVAPALTNDATPTITGTTDLPAGSTITLTVTDALGAVQTFVATVQAGGSFGAAVPAALADGSFSVTASASDAAGNAASVNDVGTIDTTASTLTLDVPALTNDPTPTVTGTTDLPAGSVVTLTVTDALGTVQTFTATVQAGGSFSADAPTPLAQGNYAVVATASDLAGNVATLGDTGAIDTTAPTLAVDAPAITNDVTPTITGTTDLPAGSTVTLTVTDALGTVQTFSATVVAGGSFSADVSAALAEGSFSVTASASDAAGNAGAANDGGAIDVTAPSLTVDAPALINDASPTISGTTDLPAGSTVTLTVTDALGGVQTFSATVQAGGGFGTDVPVALAEGSFSVTASATDSAGNTTTASDSGAVDATAPTLTIDAPSITSDSTPTIDGTTDLPAGAIITLTVTDALGTEQTFTAAVLADGSYSAEVPVALADGSFSVTASATDAAGNTAGANDSGAIDTMAPTLSVDAPAITNDSTPTITGTTDLPAGSTITLTVTDVLGAVQTFSAIVQAGGSFSADVPAALAEGGFSVTTSASDAAGNTAAANDAGAIDTAAPTLTVDAPAITNDATPTITGTTDLPAGSTVTLTVTDALGAMQTFTANVLVGGSFSATVPAALADGSFSVAASAADAAGNAVVANDAGGIDATAPTLTVHALAITKDATPTITGTTDLPAGSTVTLTVTDALGTVQTFTAIVQAGGSFSADVPVALAEGSFSVTASASDAAGNTATANAAGSVDATAPTLTVDAPAITNDATPTISGTTDLPGGSTVTLTVTDALGAAQTFTALVQAGGIFSAAVPAALVEGSFSVTASATDAAGNAATANDAGAVDTTPPTAGIALDAITADNIVNAGEATGSIMLSGSVGGDVQAGDSVTLIVNGVSHVGTLQAGNVFAIAVAGADLLADADRSVEASVSTLDAAGNTASATATQTYAVNAAPVAVADTLALGEDSASGFGDATPGTPGQDSDADGDALEVIGVAAGVQAAAAGNVGSALVGTWGTLTLAADGSYVYVPLALAQTLADGQTVSDIFTYTLADGRGGFASATLTFSLRGAEDPTVISGPLAGTVQEDGSSSAVGTLSASDPETGVRGFTVQTDVAGSYGLFSVDAAGQWRYTLGNGTAAVQALATGQSVSETFVVASDDGATVTVSVTVLGSNDAPVVASTAITASEDGAAVALGLAAPTDVDSGALLTITVTGVPSLGQIQLADGNPVASGDTLTAAQLAGLQYLPPTDHDGLQPAGSFAYSVSDGIAASAAGSTGIALAAVNDAPVAQDVSASGNEDAASIAVTLAATDIDSSVVGYLVPSLPDNGVLYSDAALTQAVVAGSAFASVTLYFVPAANFAGTVSFAYLASDGSLKSSPATVTLTLNPVADLSAAADAASGNEDSALSGSVAGNDSTSSGGVLSYAMSAGVANGTLVFNSDGSYVYTPNANFSGSDGFSYSVTDAASGESSTLSVSITVNPTADLSAADDSASGNEDTTINGSVALNDSTSSGGTLGYALGALAVAHGTLVFNSDGSYSYTPQANYSGSDSFSYSVTDAITGESSTRSVSITVNPVADLNAADDSLSGNRNASISASVAGNDSTSSGGTLDFALASGVANGSLVFSSNGSYTYTPRNGFTGTDSFSYTVSDAASGETRVQTVSITIHPRTDLSAADDSASTNEDSAVTGSVAGNDVTTSGGTLSFALATGVANGTLVFNSSGGYTYTPNAHFSGTDSFSYTVTDTVTTGNQTQVTSLTQTVSITVNPVADLSAADDAVGVNEDSSVTGSVAANDHTTSGDLLTYAVTTGVANGTLDFDSDGSYRYTPAANFAGTDSFTYTVTDADSGESLTRTVSLSVNPVADLSAADDAAAGNEDTAIAGSVAGNDSSTSGGMLTYAVASSAGNGALTLGADGSYVYTADANFSGTDAFTYTVTDAASGESLTRTVHLTVNPLADLSAANDAATGDEDSAIVSTVAGNDSTTSGGTLGYAVVSGVGSGVLAFGSDGSYTYTPNANFTGVDTFTYRVTDAAAGESLTRSVSLTVNALTDDLSAADDAAAGNEDTVIAGSVAGNDSTSSGGVLGFALATNVANGSLVFAPNGSYVYTPDANFAGTDSFTYTVTDPATGESLTRTVNLTVNPVADLSAAPDAASGLEDTPAITGSVAGNDSTTSGGTLSYALTTTVGNGTLVFASDGSYVYTPNANFAGTDAFTYTVTDAASGENSTQTVTLGITGVNDAPVASNAVAATGENAVLTARVPLAVDGDGTVASYVLAAGPGAGNGMLSFAADGTYTFDPGSDFDSLASGASRQVSFTYRAVDDAGAASALATVTITINGSNNPASIGSASVDLAETDAVATASGTLTIADVDSAASFVAATIGGSHGSLAIDAAGNWTYTASSAHDEFVAGSTYSDTFTVASVNGTPSTVTVNILGTNDAAVISTATVSLTETDAALTASGTLAISDVDSSAAFVVATIAGTYGSLSIDAAGNWSYTAASPHAEFVAGTTYSDTFNVASVDGTSSTVTVNILGSNDAAVISTATVNLTETNAVLTASGSLAISDVDSTATFNAATIAGTYGSLSIDATGNWSYTASSAHDEFAAGTTYSDTFTVASADGTTTTVTVNILGSNDAAVVSPATVNLTETDAVLTASGSLSITDVDSAATFIAATIGGTYGNLSIDATGNWSYTASSAHDEFVAGTTYSDTFTVASADGTTSTVTVSILGSNDAAVIGSAMVNLTEANAVLAASAALAISDVDSAAAFLAATIGGTYGSLTIDAAGNWSYTASSPHDEFAAGTTYSDTFTVASVDGITSTVRVNILGTNDAAVISTATVNLAETDAVLTASGVLTVADVDSAATLNAATIAGTYGSLSIDATGNWSYTASSPNDEFLAGTTYSDTFTVASADGTTSTVTVNILGTNDAAVISTATVNLTETDAVLTASGSLTISDVDSAASFVTATIAGTYGSLSIDAAGSWSYTASSAHDEFAAGTTYSDTFTVASADGTTSTVTVNILGTNDAAVISTATLNLTETDAVLTASGSLAISDVDSAATFVTATIAGTYGSLSINAAGNWSYTASSPHDEFVAGTTYSDTFTVASADGTTSTVTVNILGSNDAAVISTATVDLTETDAVLTAGGTLTVSDNDSPSGFVAASVAGTYGGLAIDSNGNWTYAAASAHDGFAAGATYSETFTVSSVDGTTSTVTVNIFGSNDAAVISTVTVNLVETNAVLVTSGSVAISDIDSPATFVPATIAGTYGSLSIGSAGSWSYTAASAHDAFIAGATYSDTFTVASVDGTTSTVTVNIMGSNDAAVISTATVDLTETNAVLTASGTLAITDVDSAATFVPATLGGTYGSLSINSAGNWTYTASSVHNPFVAGTTYTDTFSVASTDGTISTFTVNILGTNDAAVISGAITGTLLEAGGVANGTAGLPTASGTLTSVDVDNPGNVFQAVAGAATAGGYATYSVTAAGLWTVVLNNSHAAVQALNTGATLTDSFSVLSADGTPQIITITINGANDAAVIAGSVIGTVIEAGGVANGTAGTPAVSGSLTAADVDNAANLFQAVSAGTASSNGYGSYAMTAAGTWTFTLDNNNATVQALAVGATLTDTFTVRSADGTPQTITITIRGSNDAPVVGTASVTLSEEGLAGANADTTGTADTTNAVTASGIIAISDVDGTGFSTSLVAPTGLTSGGQVITWSGSGTSTLTGTVGGKTVLTATINNSGSYSVTLSGPIDHAAGAGENARSFAIGVIVQDSGGAQTSSSINVTVEDDSPLISPPQSGLMSNDIGAFLQGDLGLDIGADAGTTARVAFTGTVEAGTGYITSTRLKADGTALGTGYLTYNGGKLTYVSNADGSLTAVAADGTVIFTVTGDAVAGTYKVTLLKAIDDPSFVTSTFGALSGGNGGVYTITDGQAVFQLLLTGYAANGTLSTVNTNANTIGVGSGQDIATGELLRMEFNAATGTSAPMSGITVMARGLGAGESLTWIAYDVSGAPIGSGSVAGSGTASDVTTTIGSAQLGGRLFDTIVFGAGANTSYKLQLTSIAGQSESLDQTIGLQVQGVDADGDATGLQSMSLRFDSVSPLSGTAASEAVGGSAIADTLNGGDGNDVLWGGGGNDVLNGGLGADTFAWRLADRGAGGAATLPIDRITDFASTAVAAGGDALDLRDLLIGETTSATLDRYLDFNVVGGSTEIRISSTGGFIAGSYAAGSEDQRIVLDGIDLRAALSLAAAATDLQIIAELINRGKLLTDVPAGG